MIVFNNTTSNTDLTSVRNTNGMQFFDILTLILAVTLAIIGIAGNSIVVYVLKFKTNGPLSTYDTMLAYLGLNDLICTLIVPTIFIYGTMTRYQQWFLGEVGCKIVLSTLPLNVTISQGILILISVERHRAITKPLQRRNLSLMKINVYILCIVLLAVVLVSPRAYSLTVVIDDAHETRTCISERKKTPYMLAYSAINLTRSVVSTLFLTITGCRMAKALRTNQVTLQNSNLGESRMNLEKANLRRRVKMLFVIVAVFCFCTLPLDVYQFCVYMVFQIHGSISLAAYLWVRRANTVIFLLQVSNVVANIFIYGKRHSYFKPIFRKISYMKRNINVNFTSRHTTVDLQSRIGTFELGCTAVVLENVYKIDDAGAKEQEGTAQNW